MQLSNTGERQTPKQSSCRCSVIAIVSLASLTAGVLSLPAAAQNVASGIASAFKDGEFDVNFRYRYEFVDRESRGPADPVTENANASTLRTRLVYTTGEYRNLFLTLNMDNISTVGSSDYNSTRNGKTQYPAVADPKGTDLNLASITFTGLEDGTVVLGRQRIIRENARFVGNVGWRQNEQTYDGLSIDYALTNRFQAFYTYVDRVKRPFGPNPGTPAAFFNSDSHLFDASYVFDPLFRLFGYAYLLDLENAADFSSQTLGLRLTGNRTLGGDVDFSYAAEYATQQDYKNNPNNYDEAYYLAEAGLNWAKFGVKLGYEILGGSGIDGESFQTPLATLHIFNGLGDQFGVTPASGLKDLYINGTVEGLGGKFSLVYHDFSAQTGGSDYGSEVDFIATWSFLKNYSLLAGFALFDADSNSPLVLQSDINKVWLMLSAAF